MFRRQHFPSSYQPSARRWLRRSPLGLIAVVWLLSALTACRAVQIVEITREVEHTVTVTREVPVTRLVNVTHEVPVTREVYVAPFGAPAGAITFGERQGGAIDQSGNAQSWSFSGEEGEAVLFVVSQVGGLLKPRLWLYDDQHVLLSEHGTARDEEVRLGYILPDSGAYQLLVAGLGPGVGTYSLIAYKTSQAARQIVPGESMADYLVDSAGREFRFVGEPGQIITLEVLSDYFEPRLTLRGPDNNNLRSDSRPRLAGIPLTVSGVYALQVRSAAALDGGPFSLSLTQTGAFDPATSGQGGQIRSGQVVTDTLMSFDGAPWRVYLLPGQKLTASLVSLGSFDPRLELQGGGNRTLAEDTTRNGEGAEAQIQYQTPITGTYTLLVDAVASYSGSIYGAVGPYRLTVEVTR